MTNSFKENYPQIDRMQTLLGDENGYITLPYLSSDAFVPFPQMRIQFTPMNKYLIEAAEVAIKSEKYIFYEFSDEKISDSHSTEIKGNTGCNIGIIGIIRQIAVSSKHPATIVIDCICRAKKITTPIINNGMAEIIVTPIRELDLYANDSKITESYINKLHDNYYIYIQQNGSFDVKIFKKAEKYDNIGLLCDFIAENSYFSIEDKLRLLGETDVEKRAIALIQILETEIELANYQGELNGKIQRNILASKKEYFIREQIRALKEEINDTNEDATDFYDEKIASLRASDDIKEKLRNEAEKLFGLPEASQEFSVISSYLDCCLSIPWGIYSEDISDLKYAKDILDAKHYGLEKIKDRIIEFLAVKKLSGKANAQILCLIGPPGTGKTSIAESIAETCGRKFERIALGGIRDENEIRGHRRTYLASMPGRIMDAIIHSKVANPVILLDEVDKLGADYKGDPSAALLEVLDPEQNKNFKDHYIDLPFDLSQVIFIATANDESGIPLPLYDRMEILELSSYTDIEKFNIAKRHLIPKQLDKHGINKKYVKISDGAINEIIRYYTREAGVRNLEKKIAEILRKIACKFVTENKFSLVSVNARNLKDYLGKPKYKEDFIDKSDKIGIVNGLAYTTVGGELLPIEVSSLPGSGKIEFTGSLGDVMKESVKTAISYVRSVSDNLGIDPDFYKNRDIHFHFPENAIPKDGPSAGIGIALALISELSGRKVKGNVSMTGEITLRGKVLPIGGLKEKTMAAYKSGMKTVIVPKNNMVDLEEIDKNIYDSLQFIPAETMNDVIKVSLR
ncbi:MAG: endopeptidase La [Clostridiales bacterium]|nr:endopeptidase La [Clostridiales bacterium]